MTASQLVGSAAVPDNPTRTGLADVLGYIEEHVLRGEEFAEAREAAFGRISKEWDAPPVALMETALPADWATGIAPLAAAPAADAGKDEGPDEEQLRQDAARALLFDPTPAEMALYPAMIAEPTDGQRKLQVPPSRRPRAAPR